MRNTSLSRKGIHNALVFVGQGKTKGQGQRGGGASAIELHGQSRCLTNTTVPLTLTYRHSAPHTQSLSSRTPLLPSKSGRCKTVWPISSLSTPRTTIRTCFSSASSTLVKTMADRDVLSDV